MTSTDPIVIVGSARTPMGGFQGDLKDATAAQLGAAAIKAALEPGRPGAGSDRRSGVRLRAARRAGTGARPAGGARRRVAPAAGATTVNKMCGSGMKAAMFAHDLILAGSANIVVAGGMESMTNAPYLLDRARGGYRLGHGKVIDHMFLDGLEDAYDKGRLMGTFAEDCAQTYQFTREAQDDYALASLTRAQKAIADGSFTGEIAPSTCAGRKGQRSRRTNSRARRRPDKIRSLKPAFREGGTVTAANSSSISDGAAALILMRAFRGRAARPHPAGPDRRPCHPRAGAASFRHRADRRDPETRRQDRLDARRGRPVRDQRGLRGRRHGGDARSRSAA